MGQSICTHSKRGDIFRRCATFLKYNAHLNIPNFLSSISAKNSIGVWETKVIACYKCREYVSVANGNFKAQTQENEFRKKHKGHSVFTTDREDLEKYSMAST